MTVAAARQLDLIEPRERFEELRLIAGPEWWERWNALPAADRPTDCRDVACPYCKADRGRYCKRPSGHSGRLIQAHAARWDLALAEAEARTLFREETP
jgi:hypothetical protein